MTTAKFNSKACANMREIQGMVTQCDVAVYDDRKIYTVHIENGSQHESFWLEHNQSDPHFQPPMKGDWVSGTVNKLLSVDDCEAVGGAHYKPVLSLKNSTQDSEAAAFAWFHQQEVNRRRAEIKKNNGGGNKPE